MEVEELEKQCREVLDRGGEAVILARCDGCTMLCGNIGPRGELLCTSTNGESVVRYKAKAVLAFIMREKRKAASVKAAVNEVPK